MSTCFLCRKPGFNPRNNIIPPKAPPRTQQTELGVSTENHWFDPKPKIRKGKLYEVIKEANWSGGFLWYIPSFVSGLHFILYAYHFLLCALVTLLSTRGQTCERQAS